MYETKYRECLNKINDAIDMKLTDVFFTVGDNFFGYKNYNSKKCLDYIQNKLRKKNFDTLITNSKSIFVSWKNIVNSLQYNIFITYFFIKNNNLNLLFTFI